ncbi:MAG: lysophospholipid acyltransferase family protein [Gemmatimonadaceae bacterium]
MTATLAHRTQYLALRGVLRGLGAMNWERAGALGARLGAMGYKPLGIRRHVVERQIAAAFPGLSREALSHLARASYEHLGRVTVESALMSRLAKDDVLRLFERTENWSLLERSLAAGRGMIIVGGHLGNWELAGAYFAARGLPLDVVVRRMSNPLFDAYINRTRLRLGMKVVYDSEAVRHITRAIPGGRAIGLMADQGVLNLASTYVPFFGRPAKTPRGPAVFALRWNVPMIFFACIRQQNGRYHLALEEIPVHDTGDRESDVNTVVAAFTGALERWVRRVPEQYFWQHRRWKWQEPGTPAELGDPSADGHG